MMSMLKREHKLDYVLKNVVTELQTAISELKCLPLADQKGHAVILFRFELTACSWLVIIGTLCCS